MFNRNKKQPEPKRKHDLSQFGIFGVPDADMDNDDGGDSGGDSDLEAELAAITSGGGRARPKPKPKTIVAPSELDKMVAESLRDIGSDEELSGGDDDPDLLNELSEITGDPAAEEVVAVTPPDTNEASPVADNAQSGPILATTALSTTDTIKERLAMYKLAEKNAKDAGDNTRARRFNRGLKTLESLLKQSLAGKPINSDDIPPAVTVKATPSQPTEENNVPSAPVSPPPPPTTPPTQVPASPAKVEETVQPAAKTAVNEEIINKVLARQHEYKVAALNAKKNGETAIALQLVKVIKIFEKVLEIARQGQPVDLSDMPPSPSELSVDVLNSIGQASADPHKQEDTVQQSLERAQAPEPVPAVAKPPEELPPPPKTIMEALTQRLVKYQSQEAHAKEEGNSGKVRRMGRIVKQYQDAIKAHKAGKPVPFDELPTPPGFEPIPMGNSAPAQRPAPPAPSPRPAAPSSDPSASPSSSSEKTSPSRPPLKKQDSRIGGNHSVTSVMNKTVELLLERQREFKEAALEAKKAGEIEQAKEYLKTFKGIESLLNVARGGLPVDLSTLPISPKQREKLDESFTMLDDEEMEPAGQSSAELKDVFTQIEDQLQNQLQKCKTWSSHHNALGDIAGKNRFDNLALLVQKDLDIIKLAHQRGKAVPKFHVETKSFNVVQCNTDLAETELEINVVRGISYNVAKAKDVDTYVKVEFPYPQETPYRNKTAVIYDTDSPEYNEKFVAEIQPKARLCQRVFKRHGIKFEVYSKGGFFRSDALIGTATVKLQPLETTCEIHDSFDLMDGRKAIGGKLEVKIRIRNPVLQKQVINETEKWLMLS